MYFLGCTKDMISKSALGASLNSALISEDFIEVIILSSLSLLSGCPTPLNFFKQSLSWQAIFGMYHIVIGVTLVNMYSSKTI